MTRESKLVDGFADWADERGISELMPGCLNDLFVDWMFSISVSGLEPLLFSAYR